MPSLTELQEKRSTLAAEIRSKAETFNKNGKKWNDDAERSNWEKLNADYDENKRSLETELAADAVEKRAAAVDEENRQRENPARPPGQEDTQFRGQSGDRNTAPDVETRQMAFRGWMSSQMGYEPDYNTQQRFDQAMQRCSVKPWQQEVSLRLANESALNELRRDWVNGNPNHARRRAEEGWDRRAMSGSFFTSGGGLVFPTLMKRLELNMLAFGGMRQVATTIVTQGGEETGIPTADDVANEGHQVGENQSIGTDTSPKIGQRKWGAWTFTSDPVLVPFSLIQDTAFDLPSMLGDMLGERLGRGTNRKHTLGNGVNTVRGMMTAAVQGATTTNAAAIVYGDLVKLQHSVDPAYRNDAGYMCHDTTLLAVRLLTDTQNRPLWTSGADTNGMDRLNFIPLTINQHMASGITTGNNVLAYGQLSKFIIRRAGVARFYRLQERYRDLDQDGFVMLLREDGNILDTGTPPIKYLTVS